MAPKPFALALAALAALAGCIQPQEDPTDTQPDAPADDDASGPSCAPPELEPTSSPGGQAAVANYPGSFSYGGQMAAKTATEVYAWENPSSGAVVQWGGQSATGSVRLTIQDHCGLEIYSAEMGAMSQGGASESTQRGAPGVWWLTFEFSLFTGQMGLQVSSG